MRSHSLPKPVLVVSCAAGGALVAVALYLTVGTGAGACALAVAALAGWSWTLRRLARERTGTAVAADRRYHEVEARYRCLIEQAADAMFVLGPDDRVLDANTQATVDLGYTRAELLHLTFHDILSTQAGGSADGDTKTRDCVYRKKDGTTAPVEARIGGIGGKPGGMWVAVVRDITRRRRDEAALRESERRFRDTLERARLLAVCLDPTGTITFCNDALLALTGYTRAEVVGRNWFDLFAPAADRGEQVGRYRRAVRTGQQLEHEELIVLTRDGRALTVAWSKTLLRDPDGRPVGMSQLGEDVTERKRAVAALREREQLLQTVLAHIPCGVFWKDRAGRYLGCNEQVARDLGLASADEVVGKTGADLPHPPADLTAVSKGEPVLNREETVARNGRSVTLLTSTVPLRDPAGAVVGAIGMYQDVTDQKRLENQYRQSQKMEAVGQLAGGVAHDFNNLLTAINGYAELLTQDPTLPAGAQAFVAEIHGAGVRAAHLTRQLLAFGRRQVLEPRVVDLNEVVAEVTGMLERLIGEDLFLITTLAPDLCPVKADAGQIHQVLMNLVVNARDAMPTGGRLEISSRTVAVSAADAREVPDAVPGVFAELAVSDSGCGMTPEVREHIFEPFFTTKEVGKGTGLGLATVFGVVAAHGGHIRVESAPGKGTVFRIYLPRAAEVAPALVDFATVRVRPQGTETILLAEDEAVVRALAARILRASGYEVLEARDGDDAVRVAEEYIGAIDLLVTDVVMPRRGGRETAEAIRRTRPDLRVLFMSGYTDDAVVRNGVLHDQVHFLPKPFTPEALAREVRETLDAESSHWDGSLTPLAVVR